MMCWLQWILGLFIALFAGFGLVGCSQRTSAPVDQPIGQLQAPVSDQAAQGSKSDLRIWVMNAPNGNTVPQDQPGVLFSLGEPGTTSVGEVASDPNGNQVRDTRAGYVQSGLTFVIHTGGSSTGTQSTGGVGGQSAQPGATITQSPHQEPKASVQVPVSVGLPGSAPNANAAGAVEGNPSLTSSQNADLRTLVNRALAGDKDAQCRLAELWGLVTGAVTSQSAGTGDGGGH
ncbi:MAG: hypothetical protein AB1716_01010 [Planctomycetota bacterium]